MPTERERLDRLEEAQSAIRLLCDGLTTKLDELHNDFRDVVAELGGAPPWESRGTRPTIRDRQHEIETNTSPIMFVKMMDDYMDRRNASFWGAWQKRATIVGAMIAAVASILHLFGIG